MGVRHDGGQVEDIAPDEIGAFAAHARQAQKILHGLGHFAAVFPQQHVCHAGKVPRLAFAQAAGLDDGLYGVRPGRSQRLQRGIFGKQVLCHDIHAGVGALGRKPHADKKLPRVVIGKRAFAHGVFLFQALYNEPGICFCAQKDASLLHGGRLARFRA